MIANIMQRKFYNEKFDITIEIYIKSLLCLKIHFSEFIFVKNHLLSKLYMKQGRTPLVDLGTVQPFPSQFLLTPLAANQTKILYPKPLKHLNKKR